jgi:hypothetical protein
MEGNFDQNDKDVDWSQLAQLSLVNMALRLRTP